MINKIVEFLEGGIKGITCIILFVLEIWVILNFFYDLPAGDNSRLFWVAIAFVITSFHLYIIIQLKTHINKKSFLSVVYAIVYVLIVSIFFISSLAYNIKSIDKKGGQSNLLVNKNQDIIDIIKQNKIAIQKYNDIIIATTNIETILNWRNVINKLNLTNNILYNKISNDIQMDSFSILSETIKQPKDFILFIFLSCIWLILEIGLYMTAPILKVKRVRKKVDKSII